MLCTKESLIATRAARTGNITPMAARTDKLTRSSCPSESPVTPLPTALPDRLLADPPSLPPQCWDGHRQQRLDAFCIWRAPFMHAHRDRNALLRQVHPDPPSGPAALPVSSLGERHWRRSPRRARTSSLLPAPADDDYWFRDAAAYNKLHLAATAVRRVLLHIDGAARVVASTPGELALALIARSGPHHHSAHRYQLATRGGRRLTRIPCRLREGYALVAHVRLEGGARSTEIGIATESEDGPPARHRHPTHRPVTLGRAIEPVLAAIGVLSGGGAPYQRRRDVIRQAWATDPPPAIAVAFVLRCGGLATDAPERSEPLVLCTEVASTEARFRGPLLALLAWFRHAELFYPTASFICKVELPAIRLTGLLRATSGAPSPPCSTHRPTMTPTCTCPLSSPTSAQFRPPPRHTPCMAHSAGGTWSRCLARHSTSPASDHGAHRLARSRVAPRPTSPATAPSPFPTGPFSVWAAAWPPRSSRRPA